MSSLSPGEQYRSKSDCLPILIWHFAVSISIKELFPTLAYMNLQISLIILPSLSELKFYLAKRDIFSFCFVGPGLEVIKLQYSLRLKIKRNDWLLADTCPQAANHCALF